jgi:excinuclease ABC subunit C
MTNQIRQKVDHTEYYGPFPSAYSVRGVLQTIRQIWPFRDCSPTKFNQFAKLGHGCIFASLHLCDAPCAAKITKEDYNRNIDQIRKFLKGEQSSLIHDVETQMSAAAEAEQFEAATILRNRLYSLKRFQYVVDTFRASKAKTEQTEYNPKEDLRVECYDISNNQGAHAVGSLICGIITGGKVEPLTTADEVKKRFRFDKTKYRKFKIQTVGGISDTEMLQEVLRRRLKRSSQWSLPDLILLDGGKGQLNAIELVRKERELQDKVALGSVAKGPTRKRTDLYGNDWDKFPMVSRDAWHRVAENLREEAHRFAISYYRNLHRKAVLGR